MLGFVDIMIRDKVYVFGAGVAGITASYLFRLNRIDVIGILDNDMSKQGIDIWGDIPCLKPADGKRDIPVIVCIQSDESADHVFLQCKELKYELVYKIKYDVLERMYESLPDKDYLICKYYRVYRKLLDLESPKTMNEKLNWLKIYDRNPLYATVGDKLEARGYLSSHFGEDYLIPLLYYTYDYMDICKDNMPDEPFVIKSNCWCGDALIVRDKNQYDWETLRDKYSEMFFTEYSRYGREWWYAHMKPCVVVEKLLQTSAGKIPNDYKFHFFNGEIEFIYCSIDREGANYRKNYSPEWEELPFSWSGKEEPVDAPGIERPVMFGKMLEMGRKIAREFPYVRVDYYEVDEKLYFGEITICHGSGFDQFVPEKYDSIYGKKLKIPALEGGNARNYLEKFVPYYICTHDIWKNQYTIDLNDYKLDWNEAVELPSQKVYDRILHLAQKGDFYCVYPNTNNLLLVHKCADYVGVSDKCVQMFPSSDSAHDAVAKVWIRTGDTVLILWPTYDNFRATVELADAHIVFFYMENNRFDMPSFCDDILRTNPKMVYLCNPNNPTGELIRTADIEKLLRDFPMTLFVVDEAYIEFSGGTSCFMVKEYSNLIVTRTFSKAFGLANFRIGYLVSCERNIRLLSAIRNGKNISTFAQEAALAALDDVTSMKNYVFDIMEARTYFEKGLSEIDYVRKVYHSEGNFIMIELQNNRKKRELLSYMKNNKIYIRDLKQTPFLREHCVRITIGKKDSMERVLNRMKEL